jgi:hypothetical protein
MKRGILSLGIILGIVNFTLAQNANYKQQSGPKSGVQIETKIFRLTEDSYMEANNYKDQPSFSDKADLEMIGPGFECCTASYNRSYPDYKHPIANKNLICKEGILCCE